MKDKKSEEEKVHCPKCLGAGDLPGKRGSHPSACETRICTFCLGAQMVTKERAAQFTPGYPTKTKRPWVTLNQH